MAGRGVGSIRLPAMLTIEEEDEYAADDKYHVGDPIKKHLTISYGEYTIAEYTLESDHWEGHFYFDGDNNDRILYDEPEEFLAYKLRKLFALIGE